MNGDDRTTKQLRNLGSVLLLVNIVGMGIAIVLMLVSNHSAASQLKANTEAALAQSRSNHVVLQTLKFILNASNEELVTHVKGSAYRQCHDAQIDAANAIVLHSMSPAQITNNLAASCQVFVPHLPPLHPSNGPTGGPRPNPPSSPSPGGRPTPTSSRSTPPDSSAGPSHTPAPTHSGPSTLSPAPSPTICVKVGPASVCPLVAPRTAGPGWGGFKWIIAFLVLLLFVAIVLRRL